MVVSEVTGYYRILLVVLTSKSRVKPVRSLFFVTFGRIQFGV